MRRLYLHIYRTVLGVLVLFASLVGIAFWTLEGPRAPQTRITALTRFADASIPPLDAEPARLAAWARAVAEPFELDLAIYDSAGRTLVAVGGPLPPPPEPRTSGLLGRGHHEHRMFALALADGRTLVARGEPLHRPFAHFAAALALLGLATAVAAHPLARRLTRRLELLRSQVDALGAGRLEARVPVEGHDEIALLARAFNGAAERIERLVADKSRLLAQTSHELRTPLARVRAALELLRDAPRPELAARAERDLEELDQLIGELLVASRLDAPEHVLERERVDLLALAAEEAARLAAGGGSTTGRGEIEVVAVGGERAGVPPFALGDPRLLRRCLRNLLENALRHGEPPVRVEVGASPSSGFVRVTVEDRGPGVPEAERERIFEPFYRPAGQSSSLGGIGLGLALVRQIASRHGGTVVCGPPTAAGRGGTRFLLELPAAAAAEDRADAL